MTIITLSNGKKVGNFSSPHPFVFEDGSILPAVSNDEAEKLKVTFIEQPMEGVTGLEGDVKLQFDLSPAVVSKMNDWLVLHEAKEVDVVYCPLPMMMGIEAMFTQAFRLKSPFRAIRIEDRIKKLVSIHKQCV